MSFYSSIVSLYDHIFPVMAPMVSLCNESVPQSGRVLEVGCATGNLIDALRNGKRSFTGIDYDDEMARYSLERFKDFKDVEITKLDMKFIGDSFSKNSFDSVICFGNTLVHLKDFEEMVSVLSQMKQVSVKGGNLLLQIINYDRIFQSNSFDLPEIDNEHLTFLRKYEKREDGRLDFNTVLTDKKNGTIIKNSVPLYPASSTEIMKALEQSGWENIEVYGSFKKEKFNPSDSYHLIVKASLPKGI